jgi:hypothetical protein
MSLTSMRAGHQQEQGVSLCASGLRREPMSLLHEEMLEARVDGGERSGPYQTAPRSDPVCAFVQSINPNNPHHTAKAEACDRGDLKYGIDVMDCGGKAYCVVYKRAGLTADFTTITHLASRRTPLYGNTRPQSLRPVCHDVGSHSIVTKEGCPTRQHPCKWRRAVG